MPAQFPSYSRVMSTCNFKNTNIFISSHRTVLKANTVHEHTPGVGGLITHKFILHLNILFCKIQLQCQASRTLLEQQWCLAPEGLLCVLWVVCLSHYSASHIRSHHMGSGENGCWINALGFVSLSHSKANCPAEGGSYHQCSVVFTVG